jgi:ubiquinone/menaquinone biosynthesis C-methylase UbiE
MMPGFVALKGITKRLLRPVADLLIASSNELHGRIDSRITGTIMREAGIAAKYYPDPCYVVLKQSHAFEFPVPPPDLWEGYALTEQAYLESGKEHVQRMVQILGESGFCFGPKMRILDFGCAAARMLRHVVEIVKDGELWGVDISARHIAWCKQNLSPLNFAAISTAPHLPFEDHSFDLIYAGSVFTHIADLIDAWLLELRRILKPGGRIYTTIHDRNTIDLLLNSESRRGHWLRSALLDYDKKTNVLGRDFGMFIIPGTPRGSQVFYDTDYLKDTWGRIFTVLSVIPFAYGYQTGILLQKAKPS